MREPIRIGGPGDPLAPVWDAARAAAGEAASYAVGGPVRDLLRGDPSRDADIAVEGDAVAVARRLAEALGGRVTVHRAFETAVVRAGGVRVDLARTRSERYPHPAALPIVSPADIEADLARRDFTVNALAAGLSGPRAGRLLDPFGGRADLAAGTIRILHEGSFRDDPTRIFRAARYAARLGFSLEPETDRGAREAIAEGLVGELSGARVRAEIVALLGESAATAAAALRIAEGLGLLAAVGPIAPEPAARLERVDAVRARFAPRIPVWRPRLALIAAGADESAVTALAGRLRLARADAEAVRAAATAPAAAGPRLAAAAAPADVAELLDRLPVDAAVLVAGLGGPGADSARLYLERLRGIRLEIDGTVLRDELGLPQSPRVGEVLAELLRRKRNGQLRDRGSELAAARELVAGSAS